MFEGRAIPAAYGAGFLSAGFPESGERAAVLGAFERRFLDPAMLRLDEDAAIVDRGQLHEEVSTLLRYFAGFRLNASAQYIGQTISPLISTLVPDEGLVTHALVDIRARDGRSLALFEPYLIPVDAGVVLHHFRVSPGVYGRRYDVLFSPRAFADEVRVLQDVSGYSERWSGLESRSYLYAAIRGFLTHGVAAPIAVTQELRTLECVGTLSEPDFRLRCGDHPAVTVAVRYDPERCRVRVQGVSI